MDKPDTDHLPNPYRRVIVKHFQCPAYGIVGRVLDYQQGSGMNTGILRIKSDTSQGQTTIGEHHTGLLELPRSSSTDDRLTLNTLARVIRTKFLMIGATTIIGTILFSVVSQMVPSSYEAAALLLSDPQAERILRPEESPSGSLPDPNVIRTEADILTSPALIGRVVDRLSLVNDPEFNPKQKTGQSSPIGLFRR